MHLADLGFSDETIAKLFTRDFAGRVGFPNYALAIGDQLKGLVPIEGGDEPVPGDQ
jgi:hypothetical protein